VCILFHTAICGLGLGLGTAGLDYKSEYGTVSRRQSTTVATMSEINVIKHLHSATVTVEVRRLCSLTRWSVSLEHTAWQHSRWTRPLSLPKTAQDSPF